jgi:uncharacterized protein YkwD
MIRRAAMRRAAMRRAAILLPLAIWSCGLTLADPERWPGLPDGGADDRPSAPGAACPATRGQEVLDAVNRARSQQGLPAMRPHAALARAASAHSADQARLGRLSHAGSDGSSVGERVQREGYRWSSVGENVGGGYGTAAEVVAGWMGSPGHRAIILTAGENHAGVGYASSAQHQLRHFWTLVVARPASGDMEPAARCHP